jgi:hypothetical protein
MSYDDDNLANIEKIKKDPNALKYIYYQTHFICQIAINSNIELFKYVRPSALKNNEYFLICKHVIEIQPEYIKLVNLKYIDVYDYVKISRIALEKNGMLIKHINFKKTCDWSCPSGKRYQELVRVAVKQNGLVLQFYKKYVKGDFGDFYNETCRIGVNQNGLALQYVKEQTDEICISAIKQNVEACKYLRFYSEKIESAYKQELS